MAIIKILGLFDKAKSLSPEDTILFLSENFDLLNEHIPDIPCPICGSLKTQWIRKTFNRRTFADYYHDSVCSYTLQIPRFVCTCHRCNRRHPVSFSTDLVIDDGLFSLRYYLSMVRKFQLHQESVDSIRNDFQISEPCFYHWLSVFKSDSQYLNAILGTHHVSLTDFELQIIPVSSLLAEFACIYHRQVFHRQNVTVFFIIIDTCINWFEIVHM